MFFMEKINKNVEKKKSCKFELQLQLLIEKLSGKTT